MRSMTGYGAGAADARTARVTVELRGVNQRHLDVRVSAPREYAAWESDLRDRVRAQVERGRVEVQIVRVPTPGRRAYRVGVRTELASAYADAARALAKRLHLAGEVQVSDVLRLPELFEVTEETPDLAAELPAVRRALATALRAFEQERRREGRHLQRDMQARARHLEQLVKRIRARLPAVLDALRRRLEERAARLASGAEVDAGRMAQELAALADRGDVTEELVRLESHLKALHDGFRATTPMGKRIEFLLQEVLRELNTTGSKTADAGVSALVLEGKSEVEKLREQVQNVE